MRAVSELSSVSQPRIPRGACQAAIRKGSRPGKWARVMTARNRVGTSAAIVGVFARQSGAIQLDGESAVAPRPRPTPEWIIDELRAGPRRRPGCGERQTSSQAHRHRTGDHNRARHPYRF
jgi:hypothetical protein